MQFVCLRKDVLNTLMPQTHFPTPVLSGSSTKGQNALSFSAINSSPSASITYAIANVSILTCRNLFSSFWTLLNIYIYSGDCVRTQRRHPARIGDVLAQV